MTRIMDNAHTILTDKTIHTFWPWCCWESQLQVHRWNLPSCFVEWSAPAGHRHTHQSPWDSRQLSVFITSHPSANAITAVTNQKEGRTFAAITWASTNNSWPRRLGRNSATKGIYSQTSLYRTRLIRTSAYIEVGLWSQPRAIIKGRESIGFIGHGYIKFQAISSKQCHPRHPQLSFISNVGGPRQSAARSVSEMWYLTSLPGHKPATNCRRCHLSQALPRLPLPSAGCCIWLLVLGKTLYKQLQQQPVDFPLSEPDEWQWSLMKQLGSMTSSSGLTMVAELEQLIHTSRLTHQATITDYFSARPN